MEDCGMGEMKDIVETVSIRIGNVVAQRVTDKDAVPLQVAFAALSLHDSDLEMRRQSFFFRESFIERWQLCWFRLQEPSAHLGDIGFDNPGKGYARRPKGQEVSIRELPEGTPDILLQFLDLEQRPRRLPKFEKRPIDSGLGMRVFCNFLAVFDGCYGREDITDIEARAPAQCGQIPQGITEFLLHGVPVFNKCRPFPVGFLGRRHDAAHLAEQSHEDREEIIGREPVGRRDGLRVFVQEIRVVHGQVVISRMIGMIVGYGVPAQSRGLPW